MEQWRQTPQHQSGLQRPQAQARHLRHQSRPRLRHFHHRRRARDQLAEHAGTGEDLRGHGVRGAGADRALARLWRGHQFQRPGLRVLLLGLGDRRLDALFRHLRHLARADHPSGDGGEAGGDHRSRHRRPLRAQYRHRLEPAGDRNVRLAADGAQRPLRLRRRMAAYLEGAVDARRAVRFRRPLLQDQEGLSRAEADPKAVSGGDECRRLGEGPALRRQILRHGLCGVRLARFRRLQGQGRLLSRARPQGIRPRHPGLELRLCGAGRDRKGSEGLFRGLRATRKATGRQSPIWSRP